MRRVTDPRKKTEDEATDCSPGTPALDELDGEQITEILDGIPGAWERMQESLAQAARGEVVPLDELGK